MGVVAIFGPGTSVAKAACQIMEIMLEEKFSILDYIGKGYPDFGVAFFFADIVLNIIFI